jgi:predicted phosphodiesterase
VRLGVIADIHGNAVALEAVLGDLEPVDELVCLGDVAEGGPQPVECVARVREVGCPVVLGNTDEWLLGSDLAHSDPVRAEQARWTLDVIGDDGLSFLRTFERTVSIGDVLCFHGSPLSNEDLLQPTTPDDEFEERLGGTDARVMCGGHIHFQWMRRFRGSLFFNPGSVGFVNDYKRAARERGLDPVAEYAVVSLDGERLSLDLRRIPYDVEPVIAACHESGMPYGDAIAARWRA